MNLRYLSLVCLLSAFALAGCDALNDQLNEAAPSIPVSDGVFGLNGDQGAEATGTFSAAGKSAGIAAAATLSLARTFDDLDAGDFSEITELTTTLGVAVLTGNVGMTLTRGSAAALPSSITVTNWTLDWLIADAAHQGAAGLDTPSGNPIVANVSVTFTRAAGCAASAASCGYTTTGGAALAALFPIEVTQEAWLNELTAIVMQPTGGSNTPNTLDLDLGVTVSNPASEVAGIGVTVRVAEFETSVTPVIF